MEKFGRFRDPGTQIAPFLPIPTEPAGVYLPLHLVLFLIRLPFLLAFSLSYFFFLQWLPIGAVVKKGSLWSILGVPGMWWIDLQVDGVRKGTLNSQIDRFPQEGSIIASSSTSPIDPLYLAAIFDPIFTASYPDIRKVRRISLLEAVLGNFLQPQRSPPPMAELYDLETLTARNPKRYIVVFPECTTSNGRGILPFSPSLLSASSRTKIYPVSLRYTSADITTPIPHSYFTFLWNLCSKPTHCIRTRIAEYVFVPANISNASKTTALDTTESSSEAETLVGGDEIDRKPTREESAFLDKIAEALARLGRVKRVGLGVKEKQDFIAMWAQQRKRWT